MDLKYTVWAERSIFQYDLAVSKATTGPYVLMFHSCQWVVCGVPIGILHLQESEQAVWTVLYLLTVGI